MTNADTPDPRPSASHDPARDVPVTVSHTAPVLLRPRRGALPSVATVSLRTPSRIRYVAPGALAERIRPLYERSGNHDPEGLALFEGRLWRRLPRDSYWRPNGLPARDPQEALSADAVAEALACTRRHAREQTTRMHLWQLSFDPWLPTGTSRRLAEIVPADPPPASALLDLRDECASAMSARIRHDLLHDGLQAWQAMPAPLVLAANEGVAMVHALRPDNHLQGPPGTLPSGVEGYLDYAGHRSRTGRPPRNLARQMRSESGILAAALGDYEPEPLSDVSRCLRIFVLHAIASAHTPRELGEDAVQALAGMMPLYVRAAADLLGPDDLLPAADRIAAFADTILNDRLGPVADRSHSLAAIRDAQAYVEFVARPRIAAASVPAPEDAESLGGLAP